MQRTIAFALRALASFALVAVCTAAPAHARDFTPTQEQRARLSEYSKGGSVALLYHVSIGDRFAFDAWQSGVAERAEQAGGRRLYAGMADPVAWEGMRFDVIWIDVLPSAAAALDALEQATSGAKRAADAVSVIAIDPLPRIVPELAHWAAAISHFVAPLEPVEEKTLPAAHANTRIWPNQETLRVALAQDRTQPLFMYNLNKLRDKAAYDRPIEEDRDVSGREAYRRYADPMSLFRRGGYPYFIGKVIGHVAGDPAEPLADDWTDFVLAYYPQRREMLEMVASPSYAERSYHREAAMDRASLRFTTPWPDFER